MNIKLFLVLALMGIQSYASDVFRLPPFLQINSDSSLKVIWQTASPSFSWLEYSTNSSDFQQIYQIKDGLRNFNTQRHQATINNLKHGQAFQYKAISKTIEKYRLYDIKFAKAVQTPVYKGKSLPPFEQNISVAIFNDIHNKTELFKQFKPLVAKVDFSIFNGDCLVDLSSKKDLLRILKAYNQVVEAEAKPVLYVRGNHETRGLYARHLRDWISTLDGKFYGAFSAGPVRFIVLDTGEDKPDRDPGYFELNDFDDYHQAQAEFLKTEIKSPAFKKAKFRVLIQHIPMHQAIARKLWQPILEKAQIDLAFNGHTHESKIHDKGENNTPYPVVVGGGCSPKDITMINLVANEDLLEVRVQDVNGQIINSLKLEARKNIYQKLRQFFRKD